MAVFLQVRHWLLPGMLGGLLAATPWFIQRIPRQKHTQQCTFTYSTGKCYWFERPNHEFFEMCFDNPPPLARGAVLRDITYTDDNADLRHFVKAQTP